MARVKPLSNRKRKAQRKAAPKSPRMVVGVTTAGTPVTVSAGVVAQAKVRDTLASQEAGRAAAALAMDAGTDVVVGPAGPVNLPAQVAEEFGVGLTHDVALPGVPYRASSRDGLIALRKSKALTDVQTKAGLAFRLCYEGLSKGVGSGLGNAGEGRGARNWAELMVGVTDDGELGLVKGALNLHRQYLLVRLNQMERAVGAILADGRELHALRMIAGEGHTVREVAGSSGHARAATVSALGRALDAIAKVLRITGQ